MKNGPTGAGIQLVKLASVTCLGVSSWMNNVSPRLA
jgi:hypothetical protein